MRPSPPGSPSPLRLTDWLWSLFARRCFSDMLPTEKLQSALRFVCHHLSEPVSVCHSLITISSQHQSGGRWAAPMRMAIAGFIWKTMLVTFLKMPPRGELNASFFVELVAEGGASCIFTRCAAAVEVSRNNTIWQLYWHWSVVTHWLHGASLVTDGWQEGSAVIID